MKKIGAVFAAASFIALAGGVSGAQAHTVQQCQQELKTYASMCKFSPTAWILGLCKNKKAQSWCSNKKTHDDKFHKQRVEARALGKPSRHGESAPGKPGAFFLTRHPERPD